MAIIKLGGIVSEARGSIGGIVYARNRSGAYARARTKPVDPSTDKQNVFRTRISMALQAWRDLTADQRDDWNRRGSIAILTNRMGEGFHPTGINLFTRSFTLLEMAGLGQVVDAPNVPTLADPNCSAYYEAAAGFVHETDVDLWPAGAQLLIHFRIDASNALNFYKGPYPQDNVYGVQDYVANKKNIRTDAQLNVDSKMFCKWRLVGTNGAASSPRYGSGYKPPA